MNWNDFHFLRPLWLLCFPLGWALIYWLQHRRSASRWESVISAPLLNHLLERSSHQSPLFSRLCLMTLLLASIALAGPTWDQQPQAGTKSGDIVIILFDLSPSMHAQDIKPDRLTRARLKITDLLRARTDGQTALIAYAGEAFTVAPLTQDTKTIEALLPALDPRIMPSTGSQTEAAVERALEMLASVSATQANLLLVTDGVDPTAQKRLLELIPNGVYLSILGVGTNQGAPIPLTNGGFLRNSRNDIVLATLNDQELKGLARQLGGLYVDLSASDDDVMALQNQFKTIELNALSVQDSNADIHHWKDRGPWFVLLLLPIVAYSFRRGLFFAFWLLLISLPAPPAAAWDWDDLWLTPDQQGANSLAAGDAAKATEQFESPDWKAHAFYKNKDFEKAAELYAQNPSAISQFNLGNALAQAGRYDEALQAYDRAAQENAQLDGLDLNRKIVEALKKQSEDSHTEDTEESSDSGQNTQQNSDAASSNQPQNAQDSSGDVTSQEKEQQGGKADQNPSTEGSPSPSSAFDPDPAIAEETPTQSADENPESESPESPQEATASAMEPSEEISADTSDSDERMAALPSAAVPNSTQQQNDAWLRSIPDDPSGLLRQKFLYEAEMKRLQNRFDPFARSTDEERY